MRNCLIAGPTKSGKTILARRLVEGKGFSRIPGDPLISAFHRTFPELGIGHDKELYLSTRRQFGRFIVQFMNALAWESPMPYVVDTFHVWPGDLEGLDAAKTTVLFLGYAEADAGEKARMSKQCHGAQSGWLAQDDAEVAGMFRLFIRMSRQVREECAARGFAFVDTSRDFEQAISSAIEAATAAHR